MTARREFHAPPNLYFLVSSLNALLRRRRRPIQHKQVTFVQAFFVAKKNWCFGQPYSIITWLWQLFVFCSLIIGTLFVCFTCSGFKCNRLFNQLIDYCGTCYLINRKYSIEKKSIFTSEKHSKIHKVYRKNLKIHNKIHIVWLKSMI